jgi:hypothetical protein
MRGSEAGVEQFSDTMTPALVKFDQYECTLELWNDLRVQENSLVAFNVADDDGLCPGGKAIAQVGGLAFAPDRHATGDFVCRRGCAEQRANAFIHFESNNTGVGDPSGKPDRVIPVGGPDIDNRVEAEPHDFLDD